MKQQKNEQIIIKKYSNRRLYNTQISNYVTLEDLFHMIKNDIDFIVKDAKTEEDITRNVLTQIIFEQESKGYNLLPTSFLKQIIKFYDDKIGGYLPNYLDESTKHFNYLHDKLKDLTKNTIYNNNNTKFLNELTNNNIDFFKKTTETFYQNIFKREQYKGDKDE